MKYISVYAIPVFIVSFIVFGLIRKVNVYECFVEGAKSGIESMFGIIAPLVGLMVAISMFRESGALEIIAKAISPILSYVGLPVEVLPLSILRPISGSASLALVTDIFKTYGPDSQIGKIASVMMGSTETTFYTIAVYFGAVGIKNTRHTIPSALSADLTGIIFSALLVSLMLK
ncbi:MAG: spore maturation protein [Monoglobaceae bacterium]